MTVSISGTITENIHFENTPNYTIHISDFKKIISRPIIETREKILTHQ